MSENTEKYGCFTTVRAEALPDEAGVGVHGWSLHVERLRRDTTTLFGAPVDAAAMASGLLAGVADAADSGLTLPHLVRLAVDGPDLSVAVTTRPLTSSAEPLRVQAVRHDRMRPELKHTRTAPEFAVRDAAGLAGYDDAVLLREDGLLSEGTTWSLVLGRPDGTWVTPSAPVLPSVTVALVRERVAIAVEPVTEDRLTEFDRAAALSSGRGVHPIASIGTAEFGGSVEALRAAYTAVPLEPVLPLV